ncbi:DUF1508 domain-containing protein [Aurantibacter crassamenti]|uniref:YegP family protein n=1 Tax=Aurantibacter crassamenti TaxID=1837375 RepID=UPI00193AB606|nr:DUF1508 domain-containing protein [Aurantibacter crassamenti]MBM1107395.1 DUF1508 domain-containing protein [Aurantibacter crassamenti]
MIAQHKTDSGYTFNIQAESDEALFNSITFSSQEEVVLVLSELTGDNMPLNTFERKTNNEGKFLFNVKNSNGRLIGSSQLYNSEAGMQNGIKNLKKILASLKP